MLTQQDLKQIQSKGIDLETFEEQIENFKRGFPFIDLVAPATLEDGIKYFTETEVKGLEKTYNYEAPDRSVLKFVPASGAASRMFKHLYAFKEQLTGTAKDQKMLDSDQSFNSVYNFFKHLQDFAFYPELAAVLEKDEYTIEEELANKNYGLILDYLLNDKGLNYANLPKALLRFHRYTDTQPRMPFEEHMVEAANYCRDSNDRAAIHFTISPEYADKFIADINQVKNTYEELFGITYELTFSIQKSSTDTIAVDATNKPFRDEENQFVFRPGGHGALIENLNDRQGDIIFIKNIDNVVPDRLKEETFRYKKVLGGYLIKVQDKIFQYLELLETGKAYENDLMEIEKFCVQSLSMKFPSEYSTLRRQEKGEYLFAKLNRPIRVCGMVKNDGEPGGGPFWVQNSDGEVSLQIVESSQIDFNNPDQKKIFLQSTHFNPVDLVCGVRNYNNECFDLHDFIDPLTGFISIKSMLGKPIKVQELPGLWNGAMAEWITVFVEVPLITFNPVKTINDLLREEHL
ncbi:MAG: DUF4301 family protein [Bacteroidota bacterium]|nr:DUF4301 family protein [Bacteroidota bacterium]